MLENLIQECRTIHIDLYGEPMDTTGVRIFASLLVIHNSILNSLIGRSLLLKEDEMLLVIIQFSVELKLVDCCVRVCAILNHKLK